MLALAREELRKDDVAEDVEGAPVAEEERLVRGDRVDETRGQLPIVTTADAVVELRQRHAAELLRNRHESVPEQIRLAVVQHDPAEIAHQARQEFDVLWRHFHRQTPTHRVAIACAISGRGITASASPSSIGPLGMPKTVHVSAL